MSTFPRLFTLLLALSITPILVQAQTTLRVGGGMGIPVSTLLSEFWSPGVGLGGGVEVPFRDATSIVISGDFNHFAFDYDDAILDGASMKAFQVRGNLKYAFSEEGKARPYGMAGLGLHRLSIGDLNVLGTNVGGSDSVIRLGAGFAGGIDLHLQEDFALFVEGRVSVSMQDENLIFFTPLVGIALR